MRSHLTTPKTRHQRGFTLVEVMIAAVILLIGIVGVMSLMGVAIARNAGSGDQGTRAVEYGQDKMEQLMALQYGDTTSDTTQFPTVSSGGTGLTNNGSVNTASPVTGYVDYGPNTNGTFSTAPVAGGYMREWLVEDLASYVGRVKRVTVVVVPPKGMVAPNVVLVSYRAID